MMIFQKVYITKSVYYLNEQLEFFFLPVRTLSDYELKMSEEAGYSYVDRISQLEEELYAQGVFVKEGSHMFQMSKFKQPSREAIDLAQKSMQLVETTRFLKKQ